MSRKEQTQINEGPFDFVRGAGAEVGRKVSNSAPVRAAQDVYQAGKSASAAGDKRASLEKAIAQLANLLAYIDKYAPEVAKATVQQNPQQPAQQQNPQQQQQAQAKPQAPGQPQQGGDPFKAAQKPHMINKPGYGYQYQFNSFLNLLHGDQDHLDEGAMDFIKGAGNAIATKVRDKISNYANQPSVFKDIYNAGKSASEQANIKRAVQAKAQAQQVMGEVFKLAAQFGNQAPDELIRAIRRAGGNQVSKLMKVIQANAPKFGMQM